MLTVNGKEYPLWSQFVEKKEEWIGGALEDFGDPFDQRVGFTGAKTEITDIHLEPNGNDSAMFTVAGKDFDCCFDVEYGGISGGGDPGFITFSCYGGQTWRIKKPEVAA